MVGTKILKKSCQVGINFVNLNHQPVVKPSVEQLGSLLALKREERPEEGYWQDFLCEFHQRQREAAVKRWTPASLWNRATDWFGDLGRAKWAYGAGLAYASVAAMGLVAFLVYPRAADVRGTPMVPVKHEVAPAPVPPVEQLDELDLGPSTQGSVGEQVF